jgi:hypothetical protein
VVITSTPAVSRKKLFDPKNKAPLTPPEIKADTARQPASRSLSERGQDRLDDIAGFHPVAGAEGFIAITNGVSAD